MNEKSLNSNWFCTHILDASCSHPQIIKFRGIRLKCFRHRLNFILFFTSKTLTPTSFAVTILVLVITIFCKPRDRYHRLILRGVPIFSFCPSSPPLTPLLRFCRYPLLIQNTPCMFFFFFLFLLSLGRKQESLAPHSHIQCGIM